MAKNNYGAVANKTAPIVISDINLSQDKFNYTKFPQTSKALFSRLGVPASMKKLDQWVLCGIKEINNKKIKLPLNKYHHPTNGTDSDYGYNYDYINNFRKPDEGLGFILGNNIVCVDVDDCIVDGKFDETARELLRNLDTYVEYSQSGTGLHFFFIDKNHNNVNRKSNIELFSARKYVMVTGNHVASTPDDLAVLNGKTSELLKKYFPIKREPIHKNKVESANLEDVLHRITLFGNKKFKRLFYEGDISDYNGDYSKADGGLLMFLALLTDCNVEQMKQLFEQSPLGQRDKWIEREDYQEYQLENVINNVNLNLPTFQAVKCLHKFILHPTDLNSEIYTAAVICKNHSDFKEFWEEFYKLYKENKKDLNVPVREFNQRIKDAETELRIKQQLKEHEKSSDLVLPEPYDKTQYVIPEGYLVNKTGIYHMTKDGYKLICGSAIFITQIITDKHSGNQKSQLQIYTQGYGWKTIDMIDNTILTNAQKLALELGKKRMTINSDNSNLLVKYFSEFFTANHENIIQKVSIIQTGWHDNIFVTPYNTSNYVIDYTINNFANSLKLKGTFEDWKQIAVKVFDYSLLTRFIVSAGFASVLLKPLHTRSFTIYIWGDSKFKKSTTYQVVASIWGDPSVIVTFGGTLNGFIGKVANRSGFPFILDDKQQSRENLNIHRLIMTLNNEQSESKMRKDGTVYPTQYWKTIGLFNGEEPLIEDSATNGVHTRTLTLHIADKLLSDEIMEEIWDKLDDQQYGYAGKIFIDSLKSVDWDELKTTHKALFKQLCTLYPDHNDDHLKDVALVAVAEEMVCKTIFNETSKSLEMAQFIVSMMENKIDISNSEKIWDHLCSWVAANRPHFKYSGVVPSAYTECYGEYKEDCLVITKAALEQEFKHWGNLNVYKVIEDLYKSHKLMVRTENITKLCRTWNISINGVRNVKCIKIPLSYIQETDEE